MFPRRRKTGGVSAEFGGGSAPSILLESMRVSGPGGKSGVFLAHFPVYFSFSIFFIFINSTCEIAPPSPPLAYLRGFSRLKTSAAAPPNLRLRLKISAAPYSSYGSGSSVCCGTVTGSGRSAGSFAGSVGLASNSGGTGPKSSGRGRNPM